jgi:hypothetical protein
MPYDIVYNIQCGAIFESEHFEQVQTKQAGTYLPQAQAPRFPHGWLKIVWFTWIPAM